MSSFNQGVPTVPTLINSSNCIVLGNTSSGTALTVQQLGAGAVMNVATSTGSSALFVSSTGQVGVGTTGPNGTAHVWNVAATGGPKLSIGDNTAFAPGGLHSIAALTSTLGAGNGNSIILGRTNATNDAFQMTFMNVAQGSTTNYLGFNAFGSSYTATLAITAGGNVGIGTTSPGAQLTLTSNLYAGGMIQSAGAAGGITNQGAYMAWNLSTVRGETDFINQQGLGSGGWNWYNYNNSNQLTSNAAYLSSTGGLTLGTYSNAYTAPSGGLICPGNVGIGSTTPTQVLDVSGASMKLSGASNTARLILGPAPGSANFDYCSIIESTCTPASNYLSVLKFYTHGTGSTTGDPTLAMTIDYRQYVGIGTSPGYQLDLSTDGARKLTTTTWLTGSDQRIKTDIQSANLQMCYDTVKSIDLKYFKWNFPTESNVVPDDKHSLGFIAQEVKTVFPNAVSESNSYGYSDFLSLNTDQILKAMYGALKQTMADKEALEQSLSSLEQRLAAAGL